jgi:serine phosphatase RsbU (regulator of sigma subunit)
MGRLLINSEFAIRNSELEIPSVASSLVGLLKLFPKSSSAQLLEEMDRLLKNALNSGAYSYASDGMDIVICQIDLDKNVLNMGGANLGALVYRDGELIELKGTRRPLGLIDEKLRKPFEDIYFNLERGDIIYTFTDGYVDQFGGEEQKKLKQRGLKELLLRIAGLSLHEQKESLHQFHMSWRGELEQVDDICIMAIQYGV